MKKVIRKKFGNIKRGLPPESIIYVGEEKTTRAEIDLISYDKSHYNESIDCSMDDVKNLISNSHNNWINVTGVHDIDIVKNIGEVFKIDNLVLEDIVNTNQRPKIEDFENYFYIVLKMLTYDKTKEKIRVEQISIFLEKNSIISFQEDRFDIFEEIRRRLKGSTSRIKQKGVDYMCYRMMDLIVDNYLAILDELRERIEEIDDAVNMGEFTKHTPNQIYRLKKELIILRKSTLPTRDIINHLIKTESHIIDHDTNRYLRDLYDHTNQIIENIESFRETLNESFSLYHSYTTGKMNEIMKVLTIISTIFIPLSFLVGLYGMNFRYMPELDWQYGYFLVWFLIISISFGMLMFFRRKGWI